MLEVKFRKFRLSLVNKKYLGWLNDKETKKYLINNDKEYAIKDIRSYVSNLLKNKNEHFFSIHQSNNEHIGNLRLGPIDSEKKSIRFGLLIGDKKNWGKGIGSQAVIFSIKFCFVKLNFKRIILNVSNKNIAAIKLYEKFNFKIDKRYKVSHVNGLNLITMTLTNK